MLISKFDLYKREWLELVFDDRNKAYGAYELRQGNSRTMLTAMAIAFLAIGSAAFIAGAIIKPVVSVLHKDVMTPVPLFHYVPLPPVVHPPSHAAHNPPAVHVSVNPVRIFVPKPDPIVTPHITPAIVPPGPIGPAVISNPGPGTAIIDHPGTSGPSGPSAIPGNGDATSDYTLLERMPEPVGGKAAWSKFLIKNINYPAMATDAHAQGAVWVSFIIEADGKLSNIKVLRGPGYGMDEEAVRVLKMAAAWKPGIQNGHPVRVLFNIPIRFTISDDN